MASDELLTSLLLVCFVEFRNSLVVLKVDEGACGVVMFVGGVARGGTGLAGQLMACVSDT
jgi:hypothetical protein